MRTNQPASSCRVAFNPTKPVFSEAYQTMLWDNVHFSCKNVLQMNKEYCEQTSRDTDKPTPRLLNEKNREIPAS